MMQNFIRYFLFLIFLLAGAANADDDIEALKKAVKIHVPGAVITGIKRTPLPGIYEVTIDSDIYYLSRDARFAINGDLIDLATKKNLTEDTKSAVRRDKLTAFGEENMIVYTPEKVNYTITVITDINCPYCRKLHSEMDAYMKNGIKVRYIFMPLKGKDDFDITVSVWCAKDRNEALDMAKAGIEPVPLKCDNPIAEHLDFSRKFGVRGTPAIVLPDGTLIPGYVSADKVVAQLKGL